MISAIDQYVIDAVRKERRAQNVSQAMLGAWIGVSRGFISQVESSKTPTKYSSKHLNEIAKFLGCSPRDFLPKEPL
ncbi:MAG: helix-turn-helix transcriptional regulator [Alistipes sp.]|nr:helix-turn-helix transcriptional regulator [Alistipes sp.]